MSSRLTAVVLDADAPDRLHLHLTSADAVEQRTIVGRVIRLGGDHLDVGQRPEERHVVLVDPKGNVLCVIAPGNAFLAGCGPLGEVACNGSRFHSGVCGGGIPPCYRGAAPKDGTPRGALEWPTSSALSGVPHGKLTPWPRDCLKASMSTSSPATCCRTSPRQRMRECWRTSRGSMPQSSRTSCPVTSGSGCFRSWAA
ncbi:VOC family protein [Arsenicicoccus cauae]|uniref:VOC family protein n=1 Tax=Arsenicicoccus cauae TaxID=2663847 RepID=UPI001E325821|nr:VOC family protein [Arsenicicoccus cauae]